MGPGSYLIALQEREASRPEDTASLWPTVGGDLILIHDAGGLRVWRSARAPLLSVTPISESIVLVGELHQASWSDGAADPFDAMTLRGCSPETLCKQLIREAWGRYILIGRTASTTWAFRDPSGAIDCMTWRYGGLRFFASGAPQELDELLPTTLSLDWPQIMRQLQDPPAVSGASGLRGLDTIAAGTLWRVSDGAGGQGLQLWRPCEIARRGLSAVVDPAGSLSQRVHTCVATLAKPYTRMLAEISGGLDSAIVSNALQRTGTSTPGPAHLIQWVHQGVDDPESDERRYARSVAAKLGVTMTERSKPALRYREPAFVALGTDVRVGLTALDPDYDTDMSQLAQAHGAEAIFTGQGGDVVFFQMASALVIADRLRGERRLALDEVMAYARRWRRSIWRTLGIGIGRALWPGRPRGGVIPPYIAERVRTSEPIHPWLADVRGLPPAKAAQIRALVGAQNVFGPSLRGQAAQLLHPLLCQPVVELTLALPTYVLAQGDRERSFARDVFAAHIPSDVRDRRSKGSLQAFYGRAVADSLDVLRPWLLDGLLVQKGLIRRERLEPLLDADALILCDVYVEVLHAAAIEAWVRGWSARIEALRRRPAPVWGQGCLRET